MADNGEKCGLARLKEIASSRKKEAALAVKRDKTARRIAENIRLIHQANDRINRLSASYGKRNSAGIWELYSQDSIPEEDDVYEKLTHLNKYTPVSVGCTREQNNQMEQRAENRDFFLERMTERTMGIAEYVCLEKLYDQELQDTLCNMKPEEVLEKFRKDYTASQLREQEEYRPRK